MDTGHGVLFDFLDFNKPRILASTYESQRTDRKINVVYD